MSVEIEIVIGLNTVDRYPLDFYPIYENVSDKIWKLSEHIYTQIWLIIEKRIAHLTLTYMSVTCMMDCDDLVGKHSTLLGLLRLTHI